MAIKTWEGQQLYKDHPGITPTFGKEAGMNYKTIPTTKKEWAALIERKNYMKRKIERELNDIIQSFLDNFFDGDILSNNIAVPGLWDCPKSPFGHCAYDKETDSAWDNCIFCGKPYERK